MMPAVALVAGLIQLAPSIAKLFKGSETSVEVAEVAARVAREVTGTETNDAALEALSADPSKLLEYQIALLTQEKDLESLYVQDKNSARARDIEFLKAGTRNYRSDFLVGISVLVVFTILAVVILVTDLNEYAKGSLTTILGVFLNQLTNVFSFEFGTTRKDEEKNSVILSEYTKS